MRWLLIAVGVALLLFALDRLLLRMESRGWIYYRYRRADSGGVTAAAFGPVFDVMQPTRQLVTEESDRQRVIRSQDAQGEGDVDGTDPPGSAGSPEG